MAVVDVIDLTVSPPASAIITIDVDDEKAVDIASYGGQDSTERKNRKQRRRDERERDRHERHKQEDQRDNGTWKHDKYMEYLADDLYLQGEERKRDNGSWKHDKYVGYLEDDLHLQGEKRKRDNGSWKHDKYLEDAQGEKRRKDDEETTRRPRSREGPSPPLFLVDTTAISSSRPSQKDSTSIDPVPMVKPLTSLDESPDGPPIETGLLLPPHVTVASNDFVSLPNEDLRLSPNSAGSGIDFLDDDRAVGAPRYFHDTAVQAKSARSRGPCTRCGDDNHDFKACPNMICITCGARNEHSSRSCPIVRFCWNCKAKGHLAKDCPRIGNMNLRELNREDCERCGSWKHHGTNCPSLWRIYTYLTDAEREAVLDNRKSKRHLGFDNGGEGYIARDRWCYNCGESGHLGDDCEMAPNIDCPTDHSAFGSFNELSGPFASPTSPAVQTERPPREWEGGRRFDDGYGFSAEDNVGKRGRENAKAKAREAQKRLEADDDEPDWFTMDRDRSAKETTNTNSFSRGKANLPPKPPPPVIRFGARDSSFSKPPSGNRARPPSRPSLHDRIDMGGGQSKKYSHRDSSRREMGGGDRRKGEARSRHRDIDEGDRGYKKSQDEPRRDRGSRWRGGYER